MQGAHAFREPGPGRAVLGTECSGGSRGTVRPGGRGREAGRSRGGAHGPVFPAPPRARPSGGGREKDSWLRGSRLCQCGGARERRGARSRGKPRGRKRWLLSRVCSGLLTRRPGPPPPSRPPARPPSESGRAVAFCAARLPPDLGAGEWGPRAAREECGRAVPGAFSFLTSSGGPLPIFRNSSFRPFRESWDPV